MTLVIKGRRNDYISTGSGLDFIYAGPGDDTIYSGAGVDFVAAGAGDDLIDGEEGHDALHGGRGDDTITGGSGADLVSGGRGNDLAIFIMSQNGTPQTVDRYSGGSGNDTLQIELTAQEWANPDVKSAIVEYAQWLQEDGRGHYSLDALGLKVSAFEHLVLLVSGVATDPLAPDDVIVIDRGYSTSTEIIEITSDTPSEIVTGSGDDLIRTANGASSIEAGDGDNDVVTGGGDDSIETGSGSDSINSGAGADFIMSGDGDDFVTIGDGDDVLFAGPGNDWIVAGNAGGQDFINGQTGDDTVTYDSLSGLESLYLELQAEDRSSNAAIAAILSDPRFMLNPTRPVGFSELYFDGGITSTDALLNIENARGGTGNDTILGNAGDNVLDGITGDDILQGLDGSDTLLGSEGNDTIFGGAGSDIVHTGPGDDEIDGGIGTDTLRLLGLSTDYSFDFDEVSGGYVVGDLAGNGDGQDTINSIESLQFIDNTFGLWVFAGRVEIVGTAASELLEGTAGRDAIYGFEGDDTLLGFAEEDHFEGGPGNDLIDGGSGTDDDANFIWDEVYYSDATQGVSVNFETGIATDQFGDTDTLIDIERAYATDFADLLVGSAENEAFDPFGGNDTINGGAGRDQLIYSLDDGRGGMLGLVATFDPIVEGSGAVVDAFGDTDVFTGIEVIRGTNYGTDTPGDLFVGGAGSQEFRPYSGDDTVDGTIGRQLVSYSDDAGQGGEAPAFVDLGSLDENGFATALDGWGDQDKLKDVEDIWATGAADFIIGSDADNHFWGRAGGDSLYGDGGNDTLEGEAGQDYLNGGAGEDELNGGSGDDTLRGEGGTDFLIGGFGADSFEIGSSDGDDLIADFDVSFDVLSLDLDLTITALSEAQTGGSAELDTLVELSSGQIVTLLDVSGIDNPSILI